MNKFFIIYCFLFYNIQLFANDNNHKIEVRCDYYAMTVKNIADHTLKVHTVKNGKKHFQETILEAKEDISITGRYTKNVLKNIKIVYTYDDETFRIDTAINYKESVQKFEYARSILNKNIDNTFLKFVSTLGLIGLKSVSEAKETDGFWTNLLKSIGRNAAKLSLGAVNMYEGTKTFSRNLNDLNTKTYSNDFKGIDELIEDIEKCVKNEKELSPWVEEMKRGLEKIKDKILPEWKLETKEAIKQRMVEFAQNLVEDYTRLSEQRDAIRAEYEKRNQYLHTLKQYFAFNGASNYDAFALASKNYMDLRTHTPNFTVTIDPFINGGRLNEFYGRMPDALFKTSNAGSDLEWSDGLWNKYLGGSVGFVVSPEMRLGNNSYSKLYGTIGFHHIGYQLDTMQYRLSSSFFASTPRNSKGFDISEPIRFEQTNLAAGLIWRFYIQRMVILDLSGGYIKQNGILNLTQSSLSEGYSWTNTKIKIVDEKILPFGGIKVGYGINSFHGGSHLSIGTNFYKVNHENITNFKIKDISDNPINFKSTNLHYKVYIGWTISF